MGSTEAGPVRAGVERHRRPPGRSSARSEVAAAEDLFTGSALNIGRFRCPPGDERWFRENWIGDRPHIVFPHVPVTIRRRRGPTVVADPAQVVLYQAGEHYERRRLSPIGDRSTFLTVEPGASGELAAAIPSTHGTVGAGDVLGVRLLVELCGRADVDPLEVECESVRLIGRILLRVRALGPTTRRGTTELAHAHAVADTQRYLAA